MRSKAIQVPPSRRVYRTSLSSKGQLVIPAELRKEAGMRAGAPVAIVAEDGNYKIERPDLQAFLRLRGSMPAGAWKRWREQGRREREQEKRPFEEP